MAASLTFLGIKPSQALAHSLAQSFSGGPAGPLASCSSRSCTRYLNTSVRTPGDGLAIGTALGGRPSGEWPEAEATAFRPAPSQLRPAVAPPSRSHVEWDRWSMPRPPTHSSHALALKRSRWCSPHGHTRGWLRCMRNNVGASRCSAGERRTLSPPLPQRRERAASAGARDILPQAFRLPWAHLCGKGGQSLDGRSRWACCRRLPPSQASQA